MTEIATETGRESGDRYMTWDAPYVLGSLTRTERQEYEAHLAGCPDCQAAVADLAGLPGMLSMVDTETALAMIEAPDMPAAQADPPLPELLPRLAAVSERQRRRSRWVTVGTAIAAAAAAVAIAIPVVSSVTQSGGTDTEQVFAQREMVALAQNPVTASFKLIPDGDQTKIVMTCSYAPAEQRYNWKFALWAQGLDGKQFELGEWPAGPGDELTLERTIPTRPENIQLVEIRSVATGATLLAGTI